MLQFVLICALWTSATFANGATVIKLNNRVEKRSETGNWQSLKKGDKVDEGETVKSYQDALAVLRFESGSRVTIHANSSLILSSATSNSKTSKALWGKFDFKVDKRDRKSNFQVQTPVAVAGAEGTWFFVEVEEKSGDTEIDLIEGSLRIGDLQKKLESVLIHEGKGISMKKNASMISVRGLRGQFLGRMNSPPKSQKKNLEKAAEGLRPNRDQNPVQIKQPVKKSSGKVMLKIEK